MLELTRLLAAVMLAALLQLTATPASAATNQVLHDQAMQLLKSGKDNARAVAMLEEAAADGDLASIFMLGAILMEGKYVPQDRVRGYAYLQIASEADYPPYETIHDQALEWMASSQATMSGKELIEADKVAAQWRAALQHRLAGHFAAAVAMFTPETPLTYDPLIRFASDTVQLNAGLADDGAISRAGCAAKPRQGCPSASRQLGNPRCAGTIATPDSVPVGVTSQSASGRDGWPQQRMKVFEFANRGNGAFATNGRNGEPRIEWKAAPTLYEGVRGDGDNDTVTLLLHVDRSGWVCRAVVAKSSGVAAVDASAVDAVGLWKLNPALRQGTPVETLRILAVMFQVL